MFVDSKGNLFLDAKWIGKRLDKRVLGESTNGNTDPFALEGKLPARARKKNRY